MRTIFSLLVLILGFAGWAQSVPAPAPIDYTKDHCAECGMPIKSESYAAELITHDKAILFDDVGCLAQYEGEGKLKGARIEASYVRAVSGDRWLRTEEAIWVSSKDVRTPMGHGFHAFADKRAAEKFVGEHSGATIISWTMVKMSGETKPVMDMKMGKM